jgi:prophage antirepressor-like protein
MEMNEQALKQFDFHGAPLRTVMIKGEKINLRTRLVQVFDHSRENQALAHKKLFL